MQVRHTVSLVAFSLTLFALAGCHHPYGRNGYYPAGYPTNMQYGQPQYLPQPGYPVPGSVTVPGDNTIYTPPAGTPFPADRPAIDSNSPGLGPDGFSGSETGYGEDNSVPRPRDTTTFDSDKPPFGQLGSSSSDSVASAEYRLPRSVNNATTASAGPYSFAADYSWLKGIVKHNLDDDSYEITYSMNGDTMALAPHADLRPDRVRNGDIVRVSGQLGARNAYGSREYQVTSLQILTQR